MKKIIVLMFSVTLVGCTGKPTVEEARRDHGGAMTRSVPVVNLAPGETDQLRGTLVMENENVSAFPHVDMDAASRAALAVCKEWNYSKVSTSDIFKYECSRKDTRDVCLRFKIWKNYTCYD